MKIKPSTLSLLAVAPVVAPYNPSQELLQFYQLAASRADHYTNTVSMIAAVFGVIITVIVVVLTTRQFFADREISAYKEDIRREKASIEKEAILTRNRFIEITQSAEEQREILEARMKDFEAKMKEHTPKTDKELSELKEGLADIKRTLDINRGWVSVTGAASTISAGIVNSPQAWNVIGATGPRSAGYARAYEPIEMISCKKCGKLYPAEKNDLAAVATHLSSPVGRECPNCGNIN